MCASLMNVETASTAQLQEAIDRKMKKFKGLVSMPPETRKLVEAGMAEIEIRRDQSAWDMVTKS